MPKEKERGFEVTVEVPASEISDIASHVLDVIHDDLVDNGYPQAVDLKIFILEKAISELKEFRKIFD